MTHAGYIAVPIMAAAALTTLIVQRWLPPHTSDHNRRAAEHARTYLFPNNLPDSVSLLPPPPAPGSPQLSRDIQARKAAQQLKDTPRYMLAITDAQFGDPATVQAFSCSFGVEISAKTTPGLYKLLTAVRVDVRGSAYAAKQRYRRPQPYVVYRTPACSPADEQLLKGEGSYPSARAAVGWANALVLAELNPARRDLILDRGRAFAQSRVICGSSWQSDVDAGISLGTEGVIALHKNKAFVADFEAARLEIEAMLQSGGAAPKNCAKEQVALASR